jgi:hypothetical protein
MHCCRLGTAPRPGQPRLARSARKRLLLELRRRSRWCLAIQADARRRAADHIGPAEAHRRARSNPANTADIRHRRAIRRCHRWGTVRERAPASAVSAILSRPLIRPAADAAHLLRRASGLARAPKRSASIPLTGGVIGTSGPTMPSRSRKSNRISKHRRPSWRKCPANW